MQRKFLLNIIVFSVFLTACNATHKASVTPEKFKSNFKTLIVRDVYTGNNFQNKTGAITYIQENVENLLASRGYVLLPESIYMDTLDEVSKEMGGLINTVSGKRDDAKYQLAKTKTFARLRGRHSIDAVVYTELRVRKAQIGNYRATWDGQEEPYELNNSDLSNFLSTLVHNTGGTIPGLSILIFVHDNQDNQIYMGAGGIQLLSKVDDDDEFVDVPYSDILSDTSKIDFALTEALRKLINVKHK